MPTFHLKRKAAPVDAEHPALLVEQLSVGYPGHRYAIRDLSFSVAAGERVAFIGPNGAGKSTLFKAIVGTLPFTTGQISIHGADCYDSHSYVGYVPQQNALDWSFPASVYDVVMMGRCRHIGWFRLPGRDDHRIVKDILRHLSLDRLAKRQISELSGGQRRRVFIARALSSAMIRASCAKARAFSSRGLWRRMRESWRSTNPSPASTKTPSARSWNHWIFSLNMA